MFPAIPYLPCICTHLSVSWPVFKAGVSVQASPNWLVYQCLRQSCKCFCIQSDVPRFFQHWGKPWEALSTWHWYHIVMPRPPLWFSPALYNKGVKNIIRWYIKTPGRIIISSFLYFIIYILRNWYFGHNML